jgi:hypothetical protein
VILNSRDFQPVPARVAGDEENGLLPLRSHRGVDGEKKLPRRTEQIETYVNPLLLNGDVQKLAQVEIDEVDVENAGREPIGIAYFLQELEVLLDQDARACLRLPRRRELTKT